MLLEVAFSCLIYLKGKSDKKIGGGEKEREKERTFHLLVYSSDNQGWAKSKPGIKNSIQISNMGSRGPSPWTILHCFSWCISRELVWKQSSQDSHRYPLKRYWLCKQWLNPLCHDAGPELAFEERVGQTDVGVLIGRDPLGQ